MVEWTEKLVDLSTEFFLAFIFVCGLIVGFAFMSIVFFYVWDLIYVYAKEIKDKVKAFYKGQN